MDRQSFDAEIAKILELKPSEMADSLILEDANWDSVAQVSALLVLDQYGAKRVSPDDLAKCRTMADLVKLAEGK